MKRGQHRDVTLTIPKTLREEAKSAGLNLSRILREAVVFELKRLLDETELECIFRIADHAAQTTKHGAFVEIRDIAKKLLDSKLIDVVAAVRRNDQGHYWLCRRDASGKHEGLAGMWEYPGGKVEEGEGFRDALTRELQEEFEGVKPIIGKVLDSIEYGKYRVTFFDVHMEEPTALRCHTEVGFKTPHEVRSLEHLPSGTIFNARHVILYERVDKS